MKISIVPNKLILFAFISLGTYIILSGGYGQTIHAQSTPTSSPAPKPLLQPIVVGNPKEINFPPSSTINVEKVNINQNYPIINNLSMPGYSGIVVETLDGKSVVDKNSNYAFNPASIVKIAMAYAVLRTFGPSYRFPTSVWTDGQLDQDTGILYGNLYLSGRDMMLNLEHSVNIARELNRLGISHINGDLVVTDNFTFNYNRMPYSSGTSFVMAMDAEKRDRKTVSAWQTYLANNKLLKIDRQNEENPQKGIFYSINFVEKDKEFFLPSVSLSGDIYVGSLPTNAKLIFSHESAPMREIIKATLCYSNNFLAEHLGDMLGGPFAVARIVQTGAEIPSQEFVLKTSSGLGINRVTPKAMMKLLRAFRKELAKNNMTFADVMPVAGIDKGTLERRFYRNFSVGSVVGKTGTLVDTDGGISGLVGEISTRNDTLLFVIFNQKGNVPRFRIFQDTYISLIEEQFGGGIPLSYNPVPLDVRLANTRIIYPDIRSR